MNSYQEEAILFGPEDKLLGVLTRPTGQPVGSVGCLMFNFGVMHRVGPRRIQVKLARRLAQQGVACLRFDLSGLGDSRTPSAIGNFDEQAIVDLRVAIDQMQARFGVEQVAVVGLCSGARHGLQVALRDSRVAGLLTFDGYSFTSNAAKLRRRLRRFTRFPMAQTRRWLGVLFGRDHTAQGDLLESGERSPEVGPEGFRSALEQLVARGVAICLIHSGTFQRRDRNRDQLHPLRGAPVLDKVRYEFMANVDHSITELSAQEAFIDVTCGWVAQLQAGKVAQVAGAAASASPAVQPVQAMERSLATSC